MALAVLAAGANVRAATISAIALGITVSQHLVKSDESPGGQVGLAAG